MSSRKLMPPPVRCTAKNRDGKQCGHYAAVGSPSLKCWHHGGASPGAGNGTGTEAAQARNDANQTFAAFLASGDRRPPWTIALDAMHVADAGLQNAWMKIKDGESVTAGMVQDLVESARFAHSMAASLITTRADELRALAMSAKTEGTANTFISILDMVLHDPELGLTAVQRDVGRRAAQRAVNGYNGEHAAIEASDQVSDATVVTSENAHDARDMQGNGGTS